MDGRRRGVPARRAAADGEPAAVAQIRFRWSVWKTAEDCWLEDLYVREAARRGGLGRALVEAAVARAQERGCRRIELDVNEDNARRPGAVPGCGFTLEPKPPGRTLFSARRWPDTGRASHPNRPFCRSSK